MADRAHQYVVGVTGGPADRWLLRDLNHELANDPDVHVVEVQGSPEEPSLLIVEMQPDRAEQLQARFGGRLLIEPNQSLDMY